jgi:hypothetical protein
MPSRRRINVHTLIAQEEQEPEREPNQPPHTEVAQQAENGTAVVSDNSQPSQRDTAKPLKRQTSQMVPGETDKPVKNEEKLITKISVYLEDDPYIEKLDSLKKQYRKRTKKGTDYNKIIRILISKATLEDLL